MMGEVIPLGRPEKDPHLEGVAVCAACRHEWQAVAPVGTAESLECPSCGTLKGTMKEFCMLENFDSVWECMECRGTLMRAYMLESTPCLMCASCGSVFNALDLFPEPA